MWHVTKWDFSYYILKHKKKHIYMWRSQLSYLYFVAEVKKKIKESLVVEYAQKSI